MRGTLGSWSDARDGGLPAGRGHGRAVGWRFWVVAGWAGMLWVVAGLGVRAAGADANPEAHAWGVAVRMFQGAAYDVAERELGAFVASYTNSARLPEAYVLLGQSRFQQGNPEGALALLRERLPAAGSLEDAYRFWIAECLFRLGRFEESSQEYGAVVGSFTESSYRLASVVGQGYSLFRGGKPKEAFDLLAKPDGVFLALASARGGEETTARGYLLLGEAGLAAGQAVTAADLMAGMPAPSPTPELDWRRQYLRARVEAGAARWEAAAGTVEALVAQLAGVTNLAGVQFRADAVGLAGEILERRGDSAAALRMWERNLGVSVPAVRRQEAAANLARLVLASLRGEAASAVLQGYLAKHPGDPVLDPVRVAEAELLLQRYFGLAAEARQGSAAWVREASQLVSGVLTNAPGSWTPRAQFAAGWCEWEASRLGGAAENLKAALDAFEGAAAGLPRSTDQAVARFKVGDCLYGLTNKLAAMTNYWRAATEYVDVVAPASGLADHALYQVVRLATELGDLEQAERAMGRLLDAHPDGAFGESSLVAYGQALGRLGRTADERKLYQDYLGRFPSTGRAAELGLAVARTWEREENWGEADAEYARWLAAHPDHGWRGRAEFGRAWCAYRSGDEARALELFSAFLAAYPRDSQVPAARLWVAGFYYNQGDYVKAESEYQQVFRDTNAPATPMDAFRARLMAGRSAYRRTSYRDARTYFTDLLNTNCPAELRPEAHFELGNTIWRGADPTNVLASLVEAVAAYSRVPASPQADPSLVAEAWLHIGKCQFQLGKADPAQYDQALTAYGNVLTNEQADVALRSQAEMGIGLVLESKASTAVDRAGLLAEALGRYLAVTEGANLRAGEVADPVWVERAGMEGARLAQELRRWDVAERLYQRLMELAPVLREKFEFHLEQLRLRREQAGAEGRG